MKQDKYRKASRKYVGLVVAVIAALFLMVSVAHATLYVISTTDSSISDWASVPLFQSDPVGDHTSDADDEDIVNGWVAAEDGSGDGTGDTINFLLEVNGSPALTQKSGQLPVGTYRVAVASLDCDNNGVHQEPVDRLVIYNPTTDVVEIRSGDQSVQFGPTGNAQYGQRVGEYVEWGVPVLLFGGGQFDEPEGHCSGTIGVRFATVTGFGQTIDQTISGPFDGIDVPTAVSVSSFTAAQNSVTSVALVAIIGLLIIGSLSTAILLRRRQQV